MILLLLACAGLSSSTVEPVVSVASESLEQPEAEPPEQPELANISLESPTPGQVIQGGVVHIAGTARVFEGHVQVRVVRDGAQIAAKTVVTGGGPDAHDFELELQLSPGPAQVQVFALSAKDGSPVDLVQVDVVLE